VYNLEYTQNKNSRQQPDGMIEQFNSTLETMLSAFVRENQRDWDECVYLLMLVYRSSDHESIGTCPIL
jgi:hypothetical protein